MLKSNLHPTPLSLTVRGYKMSPGRSLSRDSLTAKTTSAKAGKSKIRHKIDFKKNEPVPEGVAMSDLSNGTKKHTSKSRETIPLSEKKLKLLFPRKK
jgi:hypothetical protein